MIMNLVITGTLTLILPVALFLAWGHSWAWLLVPLAWWLALELITYALLPLKPADIASKQRPTG